LGSDIYRSDVLFANHLKHYSVSVNAFQKVSQLANSYGLELAGEEENDRFLNASDKLWLGQEHWATGGAGRHHWRLAFALAKG